MSVFDINENIKKEFTVGDFYVLDIIYLGMSENLEDELKKMFKISLDQMRHELLNTPLKQFERLFFNFIPKKIKKPNELYYFYVIHINLEDIRTMMLKWFLRKWVKREYISGYNKPHCGSNIRYQGDDRPTKYIHIYAGANIIFKFRPK